MEKSSFFVRPTVCLLGQLLFFQPFVTLRPALLQCRADDGEQLVSLCTSVVVLHCRRKVAHKKGFCEIYSRFRKLNVKKGARHMTGVGE